MRNRDFTCKAIYMFTNTVCLAKLQIDNSYRYWNFTVYPDDCYWCLVNANYFLEIRHSPWTKRARQVYFEGFDISNFYLGTTEYLSQIPFLIMLEIFVD